MQARPEPASATTSRRGRLKVYLGATPGCGKTFAMLREGRDRREDGEDVVVGFVEAHGRRRTAEALGTLEVLARIRIDHRGTIVEEMDVDAVVARHPQVALIDELAHTNALSLRHRKRWEDVEQIRDAGIDVISTMNVQHLESVKDLVESITGVRTHETVPDAVLDSADEVQYIDITPEALRKRMSHGNVYPLDRVPTALSNFFRSGNLAALREIGLRLVAERVGTERGGVQAPPEDVVVAVSALATAEKLIRRAARLARRHHGMCTVVHVHERHAPGADDAALRALAAELRCGIVEHDSGDIADIVMREVRARGAEHVVVGEPAVRGFLATLRRNPVDRLVERLADVDVHVEARHGIRADQDRERADPDHLLRGLQSAHVRGGGLRLYIGYAPGVGTTTAMLDEGRRRAGRGTDVVVAALDPRRRGQVSDVPRVGGRTGSAAQGHLDVAALLARNPDVAVIDDIASTTTLGDLVADVIPSIRAAGITVIGTVHIGDLRSTVAGLQGVLDRPQRAPVVDDSAVDAADELEIVDIVPAELEERLRDGAIMSPRAAAHALQSTFRPAVLDSLRELTFRRVAQHQDRRLVGYMATNRIAAPWEARPRILVCVPPRPGQEPLIRRAARVAVRNDDALAAISVRRGHRSDEQKALLGAYAALTHGLGGEFISVDGSDVASAVADYARRNRITEVIALRGTGRRKSRTLRRLIRLLVDVDVHVLARLR